jgi:endonuclease-3
MTTIGWKTNKILDYFDSILPDAKCELNYNKDYELLIAVMLSAQTTDKRVNEVTKVLFSKYPSLNSLKDANINDLKKIIYPLGTYTKKAQNIKDIASKLYLIGYIPNDRDFLESLSGVGRKTTNVVLSNLYNVPCIAVDTHVSRVSKRLGLAKEKDDVFSIEKKLTKIINPERLNRAHHQFVLFGRYYCKARNPLCSECKLKDICKKN